MPEIKTPLSVTVGLSGNVDGSNVGPVPILLDNNGDPVEIEDLTAELDRLRGENERLQILNQQIIGQRDECLRRTCRRPRSERDEYHAMVKRFGVKLEEASKAKADAERERDRAREALGFYADPTVYHGCAFLFDRPNGGFDSDFEEVSECYGYDRPMPGKRARAALADEEEGK